ncbi:nucleotidyltransferase family protein [Dichotomicrobium thermohalophilum]|nr:nucleotidyltransferase family protein [Dichotomicrobium thermohalophilum]
MIDTAMVLAAGYGKRMRPLTETIPKPMVRLAGRPLIDHVLDRLAEAGVRQVVTNVHYLADVIEAHLGERAGPPQIAISDERDMLLDTGGGVKKALDRLGPEGFFIQNSDSVWIEEGERNLSRLASLWEPARMDALLLLADARGSLGYAGAGDFWLDDDGRLIRRSPDEVAPYVFAGASIAHPRLFDHSPDGAFSLNPLWDRAAARGRLFGATLKGEWMHIGTPEALEAAEQRLRDKAA